MAKAIKTALAMNLGICVIKAGAAVLTKSAGMAAEAVHSFADSGNQLLLLLGMSRSKKEANEDHPFGHGKEEYFWSFIVAMFLFVLGGAYSTYEGIHKLMHPEPIRYAYVSLIVLGIGMILEGYSWWVARKELNCTNRELYDELVDSKDASTVVVFVEDTGALLGLGIAFIGTTISMITGNVIFDALSCLSIGLLLFVTAYFLANEMRKLVIGECIDPVEVRYIRRILNVSNDIKKVGEIKTMQMGNNSCVVCADVDFEDDLTDIEVGYVITKLTEKIRTTLPEVEYIYLQPKQL